MAFLIPAIPWLIGLALAGGAAVALSEVLRDKTQSKTLAIIGDTMSGKTSFTKLLAQGIVGEGDYARTVVSKTYKGRTIKLTNGTTLHVGDLKDMGGEPSDWLEWRNRVVASDYILYLIRSRMIRTGAGHGRDRCRRDLQQVKLWLQELEPDKRPPVVLVFSFRDKDPEYQQASEAYGQDVLEIAGLRPPVEAIKRLTKVSYASGSLATQDAADKLLREVAEKL